MTAPVSYEAITLPGTSASAVGAPPPVSAALRKVPHHAFIVDPAAADTAAFLDRYRWPARAAANTIIVVAKSGETATYAVCVALATTRLDVNKVVKKVLDARRVSFAPMDYAVSATGMEHGSITPFGTPPDWPILVDPRVLEAGAVVIGGGRRQLKVVVDGRSLAAIPHALAIAGLAV
ncbi:hypothetical protein CH275_11975 [Rhodococcus sp. 06-235-1A]|uniref:YbaK/EbsC family protein n=1 Tax=Rhodococcus sp. 06-235-1A TaxID=2022508 RepID=UPI000B9AD3BF|nr:YbaK/EbsC family protein [Rhodococcus sp. 06-235-1A]OZD05302.1 hypothetical protein CH275_11975 [Rhodococcus sp. 06-235-1A]